MAKKVLVKNGAAGVKFGLGERTVVISDKMTVTDAESINALYPGIYCNVVDEPETTPATTTTGAAANTAKTA